MTVEVNDELEEEINLQYPSERHEVKLKLILNVSLKECERETQGGNLHSNSGILSGQSILRALSVGRS